MSLDKQSGIFLLFLLVFIFGLSSLLLSSYITYQIFFLEKFFFLIVEVVLRNFCQTTGIDYQETMNNWTPITDDDMKQLQQYGTYYKTAMESTKFLPSTPKPVILDEGISDVMKKAIDEAMPYYLKFKECSVKCKKS